MGLRLAQTSALSRALELAVSIRKALVGPASFVVEEARGKITVEGPLNLSHDEIRTRASARCRFIIPFAWKRRHPSVWCREPWHKPPLPGGKCNAEWHVQGDGSLCYELLDHWRDEMASAEQLGGNAASVELAREWLLNSVRWLLYRHLEAFRRRLEHWDDQWPAWEHYGAGVHEYAKLKARVERKQRRRAHALVQTA